MNGKYIVKSAYRLFRELEKPTEWRNSQVQANKQIRVWEGHMATPHTSQIQIFCLESMQQWSANQEQFEE